jgi:hypothetical protein
MGRYKLLSHLGISCFLFQSCPVLTVALELDPHLILIAIEANRDRDTRPQNCGDFIKVVCTTTIRTTPT